MIAPITARKRRPARPVQTGPGPAPARRALRRIAHDASPCRWWTAGLRILTEEPHGLSCPLHYANRMPLSAAPSLPTALHHALSQGARA